MLKTLSQNIFTDWQTSAREDRIYKVYGGLIIRMFPSENVIQITMNKIGFDSLKKGIQDLLNLFHLYANSLGDNG